MSQGQFEAHQTHIQPISGSSIHHSSFASRFFGDSPTPAAAGGESSKKGRKRSNNDANADGEKSHKVIIEPDVHDRSSLTSQLLVNRSNHSRASSLQSLTSPKTSLTSLGGVLRRSSPEDETAFSSLGPPPSSRQGGGGRRSSPADETYRVISELLPTQQIHQVP